MEVKLIQYPTDEDWKECRRRALITVYGKGLSSMIVPSSKWKHDILEARHSPIRYLRYSFLIEAIPYNISVHLCRHVHSQPYVSSLRNDRQDVMDGDRAPRDTPVNMIFDVNAEELMVIANKRLCSKAAKKTREVVRLMCIEAEKVTPELVGLLVPMCEYNGGACHEFSKCARAKERGETIPVEFIDKWYLEHYGLQFNPIADDWRKHEASIVRNTQAHSENDAQ